MKYKNTKEQYEANHRINEDDIIERRCSACGEWKEESYENFYYKNKSKPELGFIPECKICAKKRSQKYTQEHHDEVMEYKEQWKKDNRETQLGYMRKFYKNNKEYRKDYMLDWQHNNIDKIREYTKRHRKHDITSSEWKHCQEAFEYRCAYCGKTLEEELEQNKKQLHREHVDDEGANDLSNCVPSCQSCNSTKENKNINDLYKSNLINGFDQGNLNKILWWITEGYKPYIEEKPPYRILRKKNEDGKTYHFQLWTVDEKRNIIECIGEADKKEGLNAYIEQLISA